MRFARIGIVLPSNMKQVPRAREFIDFVAVYSWHGGVLRVVLRAPSNRLCYGERPIARQAPKSGLYSGHRLDCSCSFIEARR